MLMRLPINRLEEILQGLYQTQNHSKSTNTDFRIRYFTPSREIDFCGHATVASAWLLGTVYDWVEK
jgi:PhzF family phenazine biosynthesis protein